jgi:hypothetical protein
MIHQRQSTNTTPARNNPPKTSLLWRASQSGRKISKFSARSPVYRAATAVRGHLPWFRARTPHSTRTARMKANDQSNRPSHAAAGVKTIHPTKPAQTTVWSVLMAINGRFIVPLVIPMQFACDGKKQSLRRQRRPQNLRLDRRSAQDAAYETSVISWRLQPLRPCRHRTWRTCGGSAPRVQRYPLVSACR